MTPAEVLAAAADKLDALTSGASDGPWEVCSHTDMLNPGGPSWFLDGIERWRGLTNNVQLGEDEGTARYIAAMNPLVGSLLAQVLRRFADACERDSRPTHDRWSRPQRVDDRIPGLTAALDLAYLIIGGETDG